MTNAPLVWSLTVRQPWASAIAFADKRVENRTWAPPFTGCTLLIHAGKTLDKAVLRDPAIAPALRGLPMELGAVIAVAQMVGSHADDGQCTRWSMPGHHHWELGEVHALPLPVPWPGALRLWTAPDALLASIRPQLGDLADDLLGEEVGP